ncbi:LysR family transcriptional regulator [Streptomyces sp. NPDC055078]
MGIINIANLRKVDLNLLVVFQVLMEERHVTRAAAKLHLSQGAVSAALGRLRHVFDDPLFQRTRAGMVPTPRALALAPRIGRALALVDESVFAAGEFDPHTATRTFHLALSDDLESVLAPRIMAEALRNEWSVTFSFHQTNSVLWQKALDDPRTDLVVCVSPLHVPAAYRQRILFASSYACLYARDSPSLSEPLTREEYLAARHVRVSYDAQRGFVDQYFEEQGLERRAVVSVSHFAGAVPILTPGDCIATVPDYTAHALAESVDALTWAPPPIPVPRFTIAQLWKVERESQAEQAWLQELVERCAGPPPRATQAPEQHTQDSGRRAR